MWYKKKWMLIAGLTVTFILLAGVISGVAYAQTSTPTSTSPANTIYTRVAKILGIDQQKLQDAVAQAQKDMDTEALTSQLESLVSQGKLTQAQADQYKQWIQSRPNLPAGTDLGGGRGMRGGPNNVFGLGGAGPLIPPQTNPTK